MRVPFVSVVIPTYNSWKTLRCSLQALLKQNYPRDRFEVIVVDDGSIDKTAENFKICKFPPSFRCVRQDNQGPALARNEGILSSRGELILFLDSDIVATPGLIHAHVLTHQRCPNSFVQGKVLPNSDSSFIELIFHENYIRFSGYEYRAITWNLSVWKRHLESVGLFDSRFKGYGFHDLELCMRLAALLHLKRRSSPEALGYHYPSTNLDNLLRKKYQQGKSCCTFLKLHPEILTTSRWPKSRILYTQFLQLTSHFSPLSFREARKSYFKFVYLEQIFRNLHQQYPDSLNLEMSRLFLKVYNEATVYCFLEGAYTELMGLPHAEPLLLQKFLSPEKALMRIPIVLAGMRFSIGYSEFKGLLIKHGFEIKEQSDKNPSIFVFYGLRNARERVRGKDYLILFLPLKTIEHLVFSSRGVEEFKSIVENFQEIWVTSLRAKALLRRICKSIPIFVFFEADSHSNSNVCNLSGNGKKGEKLIWRLYRIYSLMESTGCNSAMSPVKLDF